MEIGTLEGLKSKLGIAASDRTRDAELEITLLAARRYVLRTVRYAAAAGEVTELHENVREGDALRAMTRPLDSEVAVVVEGRRHGSDTWTVLSSELIDPIDGRLRVVKSIDSPWPAIHVGWSPFYRRNRYVWPILRLSYTALDAPLEGLEDLSLAVEVLAASWDRDSSPATGLKSQPAGIVSEEYATSSDTPGPIPRAVSLILAAFTGGGGARLSR